MSVMRDQNLGRVWRRASGTYNGMDSAVMAYAWLTPAQRCRVERLRQARMLFDGLHREYFVDEGRSRYEYPPLREGEDAYFVACNLLSNVAQKMADLLFGEACRIHIDDAATQLVIDGIVQHSWLPARLNGAAVECHWAGETYLEVMLYANQAMIDHVPAAEIFPVGSPGPDYQYREYVRYATAAIDGEAGKAPRLLLLETHYTAGKISRALYELKQTGPAGPTRAGEPLSLDLWPTRDAAGNPLAEEVVTGLDRPSIVYVPNGYEAISDFETLIEIQDELHSKHTQIGRVIAKHADPKMYAPESAADDKGNLPNGELFFGRSKEDIPQYIVWKAELEAAMQDRDFTRSTFSVMSEMPLSLLGVKDDSAVETASKMRLNASPALAKASRKAAFWQAAISLAMAMAIEVETGRPPAKPIAVEMRDGLPEDEAERADTIASLRGAKVMSRKRALQAQWLDPAAVKAELAELDQEAKDETPSVLLGEPKGAGFDAPVDNAA